MTNTHRTRASNTPADTGPRAARSSAFARWRTSDILITAVIGVVFGVVFWGWNTISPAFDKLFAGSPWGGLVVGVWLIPGVLAPLITKRAGSGILAETLAALVSVLFGAPWSGGSILLYGVLQGIGAEVGFAVVLYRSWKPWVVFLSGATAGFVSGLLDVTTYYPEFATGWKVLHVVATTIGALIVCGIASLALYKALQASGALPARRDHRRLPA